ncbi:cation diffusion facilitator family transporter [Acidovorax sp. GBBC 3334]|uniref:cation diffusion facilitator family transporter n=1 Tax=Acidovorax sp. GBBC 3334 TaxID=2940496 RepID=UPI0023049A99|nr:cation diffusion facilitator family transporter [Acidovorax sp. GBBC 3334]MDA8455492.1 cation diffusion facilitator family transporter [Acidovorax sp. GBBC 3334]
MTPLPPRTLLWTSVAVAVVTILLKGTAWYLTGSVGLLSDALESFVNLAGAVFALMMVTVAQRPADGGHPFGHHKAEYFSSGFEGILVLGAALAILWASVHRLFAPAPISQLGWGLALSVASSALNGLLAWLMLRSARVYRSAALEGDARHLLTDVWTSAGVVVGILGVLATGWLWLDPVVAILVALNIAREGGRLVWRASQGLMDEALEPPERAAIDGALAAFARHQPGVRFDHVATRRAGQRRHVALHLHVPGDWSLSEAARLRAAVERALVDAVPGLRATIELLPTGMEAVATPMAEYGPGSGSGHGPAQGRNIPQNPQDREDPRT